MFSLKDKNIVIFGANGSIGSTIAHTLLGNSNVSCIYNKNYDNLPVSTDNYQVCTTLKIRLTPTLQRIVDKHGKIDVIINCIGATKREQLTSITENDWDNIIDINLKSCYNIMNEGIKFLSDKGKIINFGSLSSRIGIPNLSAYTAAKGAIEAMSRSTAIENPNLCINCILPGRVETEMTKDLPNKEEMIRVIPKGRMGTPEDLLGTVIFLASSASDYITGQSIVVDGGWLAGGGNING